MDKLKNPWVSFCISTYKRPALLQQQLIRISGQIFTNFEVVISDNDPEASAKNIVANMKDPRFKYYQNGENLGMIKSFNKSIERSNTEFIVMVTDDDPIEACFLDIIYKLHTAYPRYSVYAGFLRKNKKEGEIEIIPGESFIAEILDPGKTTNMLWSSAVLKKNDAIEAGLIPDYGGPHLSDHAFIALTGKLHGGVIINKMFSTFSSHDSNFSKNNLANYIISCKGFYESMSAAIGKSSNVIASRKAMNNHLSTWFTGNFFSLKKYYTIVKKDDAMLKQLQISGRQILEFSFMKKNRPKFYLKSIFFFIKKKAGLLR